MRSATNQKLTNQQIQEIKQLKANGVRISLIAKILHIDEGLAISATYYHLSDNRQAYDNHAKKIRSYQKEKIRQRIRFLIEQGFNTQEIANDWNIPLANLNRLYVS